MLLIQKGQNGINPAHRLARLMYNMENGSLILDGNGNKLEFPEIFPSLKIEPETKRGLPFMASYTPTVGIVFYIAHKGFRLDKLLNSLKIQLEKLGNEHLLKFNHTTVSSSAILMQKGRVVSKTITKTQTLPFVPKPQADADNHFARILCGAPENYMGLPSHVSYCSAFTWYFINAAVAIDMVVNNMHTFNASIASIVYDVGCVLAPPKQKMFHGLCCRFAKYCILSGSLRLPKLPENLYNYVENGQEILVINDRTKKIRIAANGHFLKATTQARPSLFIKWAQISVINQKKCWHCQIPLWGDVTILFNPKYPDSPKIVDGGRLLISTCSENAGKYIILNKGVAFCQFCAMLLPPCIEEHLSCKLVSSTVPKTQAESLQGSPLEGLGKITDMLVTAKLLFTGAFVLDDKVIVIPKSGTKEYLGHTIIMERSLPVFEFGSIVEEL